MRFEKAIKEFRKMSMKDIMMIPIKELMKRKIDNVPMMGLVGILLIGYGSGMLGSEIHQGFFTYYIQDSLSPSFYIFSGLAFSILGLFMVIKSMKKSKGRFALGEKK